MGDTAIILCKCRGENFSDERYNELAEVIGYFNADLFKVDDLCAAVLTDSEKLTKLGKDYSSVLVLACQVRAVKHLLIQNKVELTNYKVINYRDTDIHDTITEINKQDLPQGRANVYQIESDLKVPSWFPVIDQERCTSCGRCVKFCLFGVYRIEDETVHVDNPLHCKNNCPACARSCPVSAIIFPKYKQGGVISGAELDSSETDQQPLEGNFLKQLSERKAIRKSILKSSIVQKAEDKRDMTLKSSENRFLNNND